MRHLISNKQVSMTHITTATFTVPFYTFHRATDNSKLGDIAELSYCNPKDINPNITPANITKNLHMHHLLGQTVYLVHLAFST